MRTLTLWVIAVGRQATDCVLDDFAVMRSGMDDAWSTDCIKDINGKDFKTEEEGIGAWWCFGALVPADNVQLV